MAAPVLQLRVPEDTLARIEQARGGAACPPAPLCISIRGTPKTCPDAPHGGTL